VEPPAFLSAVSSIDSLALSIGLYSRPASAYMGIRSKVNAIPVGSRLASHGYGSMDQLALRNLFCGPGRSCSGLVVKLQFARRPTDEPKTVAMRGASNLEYLFRSRDTKPLWMLFSCVEAGTFFVGALDFVHSFCLHTSRPGVARGRLRATPLHGSPALTLHSDKN
jgi:hypothetical protein